MKDKQRFVDPTIFELIGYAADLLGLGEHIQNWIPTDRYKAGRRHKRVIKLLDTFDKALQDARAALRLIISAIQPWVAQMPDETIGFSIPAQELPVFHRGIDQVLRAMRVMTNASLELEK